MAGEAKLRSPVAAAHWWAPLSSQAVTRAPAGVADVGVGALDDVNPAEVLEVGQGRRVPHRVPEVDRVAAQGVAVAVPRVERVVPAPRHQLGAAVAIEVAGRDGAEEAGQEVAGHGMRGAWPAGELLPVGIPDVDGAVLRGGDD